MKKKEVHQSVYGKTLAIKRVAGDRVHIKNIDTIARIGHKSKRLEANMMFLCLDKKVQELIVLITKGLIEKVKSGESRYYVSDRKAIKLLMKKYPKTPKSFWVYAFGCVIKVTGKYSALNVERSKLITNLLFPPKKLKLTGAFFEPDGDFVAPNGSKKKPVKTKLTEKAKRKRKK